jgi:Eco57I restriction-modification methylase
MDLSNLRKNLQAFDFRKLFVDDLGWDHLRINVIAFEIEGVSISLNPIAQKRGFQVFEGTTADGTIPLHATRMKLERELSKIAFEHLIVFIDENKTQQCWQWARRESGKPLALKTPEYHKGKTNEDLIQKLSVLAFSLDEEEHITLTDVTRRSKKAFDVEKVTKRFYELFQQQHGAFYQQVSGLPDEAKSWYTSLMLNRLMFIYFVQKKGFLDNDVDYLRDRLTKVQGKYGAGKFQNFYQNFLLALFHEGLGKDKNHRQLNSEMLVLLGNVPYLNGGLFEVHQLENEYKGKISIPDEAFEQIFSFFDQYQWHLDDRPLSQGNEINPDVLGYIFEKYINQKQMGAYYTKEDITEYISKNTVLTYLLQTVSDDCKVAFSGERSVWRLLVETPDRYIYPAVKHGADEPLPPNIEAGIKDVSKRTDWNRTAPNSHALPTEIWREVVARRTRYQEVRAKLAKGEVSKVEDLITLNLNIRQFAQDALDTAEGADLVQAFWKALTNITILDPTCGSGAFLFAALNILQPLYEAALDKMQSLVNEADAAKSTQKYPSFRKTLTEVAKHPNEPYFVLKTIVVNNLYGVDIMEEATEIAKLRLFLKLMSQVETPEQIEPLPDVDFNIRAGNALVGFATEDELDKALSAKLDLFNTKDTLKEKLDDVEALFKQFRLQQTEYGGTVTSADKQALRKKLSELEEELNRHLAGQYGIDPNDTKTYPAWKKSHQPFHWFVDFYSIMKKGGFDAIIGNPPYVEYSKIKASYKIMNFTTEPCGNLYAYLTERSINILNRVGYLGLIIPISSFATERMNELQQLCTSNLNLAWSSNYGIRPSKLFEGAEQRLTILIGSKIKSSQKILMSKYRRWYRDERDNLFGNMIYIDTSALTERFGFTKVDSAVEKCVFAKLPLKTLSTYFSEHSSNVVYWHRIPAYFIKCVDFIPYFHSDRDGEKKSEDYKQFRLSSVKYQNAVLSLLNSNLFYWYWFVCSEGYHCGKHEVLNFPIDFDAHKTLLEQLDTLALELMKSFRANSMRRVRDQKTTRVEYDEFYPSMSKPIIDQIDQVLAKHYGFTDEELDFIINYDIKYRMGRSATQDED